MTESRRQGRFLLTSSVISFESEMLLLNNELDQSWWRLFSLERGKTSGSDISKWSLFLLNKINVTLGMFSDILGCKVKACVEECKLCFHFRSDKKSDSAPVKNNKKLPPCAVPPPIPMSPIVEKMEGLKEIRNRSNSLRLGRLAFYRHLEKVETMRCFWELKHVELECGKQQVTHRPTEWD